MSLITETTRGLDALSKLMALVGDRADEADLTYGSRR